MAVPDLLGACADATLSQLLLAVREKGGSDLHLAAGMPPLMRLHGELIALDCAALNAEQVLRLCSSALDQEQRHAFDRHHELDFALEGEGGLRCRGNLLRARDHVGGVFRIISCAARTAAELGMPAAVERLADLPRGLVLVTGATGSGKSTTLTALIEKINGTRAAHVVTIEDPIEFLYTPRRSLVRQREVQRDTTSFVSALRHLLRQDPDVVLIGEIRDCETAAAALLIADTGHLVLSTLHSNSAVDTVQRLVSLFPAEQQPQSRHQMAAVLQAVVCQQLVARRDRQGRVAAFEVLIATPAIRNLMREDKLHQIYSQLQTGKAAAGMQTMSQALADLCLQGVISESDALAHSPAPDDVRSLLSQKRPLLRAGGSPTALLRRQGLKSGTL